MKSYDLWRNSAEKLDYSLITLAFAVMALSFQFSPAMGKHWPWVLIASWACYLFSALCGGLRGVRMVTFSRLENQRERMLDFIRQRVPMIISGVDGNMFDELTGEPMTKTSIKSSLEAEHAKLKDVDKLLSKAGEWMVPLFRGQFWGLVLGLLLNGVFVAKNFLEKSSQ